MTTSLKSRQSFSSSRTPWINTSQIQTRWFCLDLTQSQHTCITQRPRRGAATHSSARPLVALTSPSVMSRSKPLLRFDVTQWTLHKWAADRYRFGPTDGSGTGRYCLPLLLSLPRNICSALQPLSLRSWSTDELGLALVGCYCSSSANRGNIPIH
jgi:hypothetical protein